MHQDGHERQGADGNQGSAILPQCCGWLFQLKRSKRWCRGCQKCDILLAWRSKATALCPRRATVLPHPHYCGILPLRFTSGTWQLFPASARRLAVRNAGSAEDGCFSVRRELSAEESAAIFRIRQSAAARISAPSLAAVAHRAGRDTSGAPGCAHSFHL